MKYNSIGEQLIAKAQELDPNYKPDKFNDMSEALDVILNNSGGGSGREILELNEADSNTVQFITPGQETTLTGVYDLNKTYKGFKITASDMERTYYFNAMAVVPSMNFKAYSATLYEINSDEIIHTTYEIGIINNTISIVYKNESLPLTGGGSNVTITFEN